jgi:hypothetical protein
VRPPEGRPECYEPDDGPRHEVAAVASDAIPLLIGI